MYSAGSQEGYSLNLGDGKGRSLKLCAARLTGLRLPGASQLWLFVMDHIGP